MNTLIDFIKIILSTGLIIYVYFALIKKLSNNIKVFIFPLILFIISILYGYGAYKKSDDIILIFWIVLFSSSILFIIRIIEKVHTINLKKRNPIENIINKTNLNHIYQTNIHSIDNSKTFNTSQINKTNLNHNYQTNIETIDNSSTLNISQTNNHLEQINNVTNIEIVENSIKTNNQDIFSFKKLNESKIMELFDSNINNIHDDSKDDFLQILKGFIPKNKIIWKGTSGKGKTNITYTGIFILLQNILNLPTEKLEKNDRKKLIEFIIKTFKKYNNYTEDYCNEIPFDSLNGAYSSFNFNKYSNLYSN